MIKIQITGMRFRNAQARNRDLHRQLDELTRDTAALQLERDNLSAIVRDLQREREAFAEERQAVRDEWEHRTSEISAEHERRLTVWQEAHEDLLARYRRVPLAFRTPAEELELPEQVSVAEGMPYTAAEDWSFEHVPSRLETPILVQDQPVPSNCVINPGGIWGLRDHLNHLFAQGLREQEEINWPRFPEPEPPHLWGQRDTWLPPGPSDAMLRQMIGIGERTLRLVTPDTLEPEPVTPAPVAARSPLKRDYPAKRQTAHGKSVKAKKRKVRSR